MAQIIIKQSVANNDKSDEISQINSKPPLFKRWKLAVKWQPDEFVMEACKLGHVFGSQFLLPQEIRVINDHFNRDWQDIINDRIE